MSLSRTLQSSHLGSKSEVASKCWAGHQVLGFPRSTVNLGTVLCAECYMGQSLSTREEAVDRFIEMCVWEKASYSVHAAAKSLQLGPTLCDPIDGSPQGSPIPGILQARTLEWVAISFSSA